MATKTISWSTGTGSVTATYTGSGDGTIQISSDPNSLYENRSMQITVKTTDNSISKTITVSQAAKSRIDISTATVTALNQTYSGSALTPTVHVILNGAIVDESGYDVAYSDNINAGIATITVTGKGDYTGTATGTFTISKASRTLSFGITYAVVAPSGNITKTATPSAGSGDGAITYSISSTTYATIDSSSGKVTAKTSEGSAIVTATIAEGTNYLSASKSYNLYVFATTHNFAYTGSVQSCSLPPGSYKLQCWGAQGGQNPANSTYGITSQNGGKGGYSEGVLTINSDKTVYVFVGGQPTTSSANGGWNGGGGNTGTSTNGSETDANGLGVSMMGRGGGGTDIALTTSSMSYSYYRTNRSSASLLSRMIVAGGGSGGAMAINKKTTSQTVSSSSLPVSGGIINSSNNAWYTGNPTSYNGILLDVTSYRGKNCQFTISTNAIWAFLSAAPVSGQAVSYAGSTSYRWGSSYDGEVPSNANYLFVQTVNSGTVRTMSDVVFTSSTITSVSQVGYVGGGTSGGGNGGTQSAAGDFGGFGYGARFITYNMKYTSACGGGGWYGGGANNGNVDINDVKSSGGGSGFVNTSANAQYRPTGYTGLQLDSGTTKAGNTSFEAPGGGTETGHAGNGYARITRL